MGVNLSCENKQRHATLLVEEGILEMKCDRPFCGAGQGRVVLHRFDIHTGDLVGTVRFSTPSPGRNRAR